MNRNFWKIFIVILIVAAIAGGYFIFQKQKSDTVTINGKDIKVEFALTEEERTKGLMNRQQLDANTGMLFVFPQSSIYTFWMKDTLIALDIIWLAPIYPDGSRGSEVEGISKIVEMTTLQPQSTNNIPQYTPKNKANYVLEVNAGFTAENNIKVGDLAEIKI